MENSGKELIHLEMEQNNCSNENPNRNASNQNSSNPNPSEEIYSMNMMKQYPLGFNEPESEESKGNAATPRKKKKPKKQNDDEEEENANENEQEEDLSCIYNVWVLDCMRSKKDFIECQQINMEEVETKDMFEKLFSKHGFFIGILDYEEFMLCGKASNSRILQGVEYKFGVSIDVSDSFYSFTGAKLRAYSFQGASRKSVFMAFSYFSGTWTQEMAIYSVTNYDVLFQPEDWYYSVIMNEQAKAAAGNDQVKDKEEKPKSVNVSNKICLSNKSTNKNISNLKLDESYRRILNSNRIDTNSEIDSMENINNENKFKKEITKKNDQFFNLCFKYLKAPKLKLWKLLFANIKKETESISYTISNVAKMVNENNNKIKDSMSINVPNASLSLNPTHEIVDFLLDTYNKPIPIWIKLDKTKILNI